MKKNNLKQHKVAIGNENRVIRVNNGAGYEKQALLEKMAREARIRMML
jgi:hypothetical protein